MEQRDDDSQWKYLLEQLMAELAEHTSAEVFTSLAKRPAWQAAMAAREGRPAKGPPRIAIQYKPLFSKAEPIPIPLEDTIIEQKGRNYLVTLVKLPERGPYVRAY